MKFDSEPVLLPPVRRQCAKPQQCARCRRWMQPGELYEERAYAKKTGGRRYVRKEQRNHQYHVRRKYCVECCQRAPAIVPEPKPLIFGFPQRRA